MCAQALTIEEALLGAREVLGNSPDAEILLAFLLKKRREHLIAHPEGKVGLGAGLRFRSLCARRARGVPVAYLTKHKEFFGLDFYVDKKVLIPRPETEFLVEAAIAKARGVSDRGSVGGTGGGAGGGELTFCDVGTGSGCIAISVAKNVSSAKVVAVDISGGALSVAKKNARIHGVENKIEFLKSDLFTKVLDRKFDGILANLPYIGRVENNFVSSEVVENEPHRALFGGETGLELFEKLFEQIAGMQNRPKWLIGEIGFTQKEGMTKLIREYFPKISIEWKNDLAGLPRTFIVTF